MLALSLHLDDSTKVEVRGEDGRAWVKLLGRDGEQCVVFVRTPRAGERMADAFEEAARLLRKQGTATVVEPFDLEAELERTG